LPAELTASLVCTKVIKLTLDVPTSKFGEALRAQVEERLNFFEVGHVETPLTADWRSRV
jgi:hypothetical protein